MDILYFITIIAWCFFILYSFFFSLLVACVLFTKAKATIKLGGLITWFGSFAWIIAYYFS